MLGRGGAGVNCEPATFYIKLHIICQETLHVVCKQVDNVYRVEILDNLCIHKENHVNMNSVARKWQIMRNYCQS
jgi:uncharacterized protein